MLRTGSICMSLLYNYLTDKQDSSNSGEGEAFNSRQNKLKCLSKTFASYGGVLTKISQILCYADGDHNNNVFSECNPVNSDKTVAFFKNEFYTNCVYELVDEIDFTVYKGGSIGQIHRAVLKDGTKVIFKVQYVGLRDGFETDLVILEQLIVFLYSNSLDDVINQIKTKLYEELDYNIEIQNQTQIYELWKDDREIRVPFVIPNLSSEKILCMEYIEGITLNTFIENSSDEQRNIVGMNIFKFIFTNIYKHNLLYSDIHYGNFIIKDDLTLYVTDFGCINKINDKVRQDFIDLHENILSGNIDKFYLLMERIGACNDDISVESKNYLWEYFNIQYKPLTTDNFKFTDAFASTTADKNFILMSEWTLPTDLVYFNKIPYGLYHILAKLNTTGDFLSFFKELLPSDFNKF